MIGMDHSIVPRGERILSGRETGEDFKQQPLMWLTVAAPIGPLFHFAGKRVGRDDSLSRLTRLSPSVMDNGPVGEPDCHDISPRPRLAAVAQFSSLGAHDEQRTPRCETASGR